MLSLLNNIIGVLTYLFTGRETQFPSIKSILPFHRHISSRGNGLNATKNQNPFPTYMQTPLSPSPLDQNGGKEQVAKTTKTQRGPRGGDFLIPVFM